jgi:ligand-binding sensor domain-containing protein
VNKYGVCIKINKVIWFPIENNGSYLYNRTSFANYSTKDVLLTNTVQSIYQDKKGRIWLSGCMRLFNFDGDRFHYMTKNDVTHQTRQTIIVVLSWFKIDTNI